MRKALYMVSNIAFLLLSINSYVVLGQGMLNNYTIEKKIEIPIGRGEGKVMVRYLVLGRYVDFPRAIVFDYAGNIIIGSSVQKSRVQKLDSEGLFIKVIAYAGDGIENIGEPMRIRVDRENNVYVGDAKHKNIVENFLLKKFNSEGYFLGTIEKESWRSRRRRGLSSRFKEKMIEDFWISPMGNVYIKDYYSPRILSFNSEGEYLGETDYSLVNSKGEVFVESGHNRWSKYVLSDEQKRLPNTVSSMNQEKGFSIEFDPNSSIEFLGFDKDNNLFFLREGIFTHQPGVSKFNCDYILLKYSSEGELLAEVDLPEQGGMLRIDPDGNVYQLDLVYETCKEFTPGDHIEIVKWAPQVERYQEK